MGDNQKIFIKCILIFISIFLLLILQLRPWFRSLRARKKAQAYVWSEQKYKNSYCRSRGTSCTGAVSGT